MYGNFVFEKKEKKKHLIYSVFYKNILNFFKNYYSEELLNFFKKIKKIKFSIVVIGKKINEYKVFEYLNSKGIDLKINDLLRNYFAKRAEDFHKKNPKIIIDEYEFFLNDVENFLTKQKNKYRSQFGDQIGRWFKNFIIYKKFGKLSVFDRNDKKMYLIYKKEINSKITTKNHLSEEINLLKEYLGFCKWINSENDNNLFLINETDLYPLIFIFYKKVKLFQMNNIYNSKWINLIVVFYVYLLCNGDSIKKFLKKKLETIHWEMIYAEENNLDVCLKKIFNILFDENSKEDIKIIIEKKIIKHSDVIFQINSFSETKKKRFIIYFFAKMEEIEYFNDIQLRNYKLSIEHIMPKEPVFFKLEKNEKKNYKNIWLNNVDSLQNLCVMEKELNNDLDNNFFEKKKELFKNKQKNSVFQMVNDIFKNDSFSEEELQKRKKQISEFVPKFAQNIIEKIAKI